MPREHRRDPAQARAVKLAERARLLQELIRTQSHYEYNVELQLFPRGSTKYLVLRRVTESGDFLFGVYPEGRWFGEDITRGNIPYVETFTLSFADLMSAYKVEFATEGIGRHMVILPEESMYAYMRFDELVHDYIEDLYDDDDDEV
jgi:hypothetical protein